MKARIINDRYGSCGFIESPEVYDRLLRGEIDWKEHIKKDIVYYKIPASVFNRLFDIDRKTHDRLIEFAKKLKDAFPESNRDNLSPSLYWDDYCYLIDEVLEGMKGDN